MEKKFVITRQIRLSANLYRALVLEKQIGVIRKLLCLLRGDLGNRGKKNFASESAREAAGRLMAGAENRRHLSKKPAIHVLAGVSSLGPRNNSRLASRVVV